MSKSHDQSVALARVPEGRAQDQARPILIETHVNRYAEGSVLIRYGNTHVLCTASIEEEVPQWMRGKGRGWITAEYSMLPRATHTRTKRDREKVSGRTQEIQRLIGRALRAMVDLKALGERSILVDCDVLQADGGTRTASITGACVAVALAVQNWIQKGKIQASAGWQSVVNNTVSAISVGIQGGKVLVDLDYSEDSTCEVDMNFVITGSGQFVEVQGTAEGKAFSQEDLQAMTEAAIQTCRLITEIQQKVLQNAHQSAV